jgi:hypothetical protein
VYNNLKGKNLVRLTYQRRCLKFKPAKSGREESLPSTDEGELNAITRAVRHGDPLFFIRTGDGVTLDVHLNRTNALQMRDAIRTRFHNGGPRIDVYERHATALIRL